MGDRLLELQTRLESAARKHWTYRLEALGASPDERLWHVHVPARGRRLASLCLASGIHGDQPAGIEALLRMLDSQPFPHGLEIDVFPVMNPAGFRQGTREDAQGRDLDGHWGLAEVPETLSAFERAIAGRHYDLFLDLHEQPGGEGFFAREIVGEGACLAPLIVSALSEQKVPLESIEGLTALLGAEAHVPGEFSLEPGLATYRLSELPLRGTTQACHMRSGHAAHAVSFVVPARLPLERRVQILLAALSSMFRRLRERGMHAVHHDPYYFASAWMPLSRRNARKRT